MRKILVAIDKSKGAVKSLELVGQLFAGAKDLKITIFHALPNVPTEFWDDGHILAEGEEKARREVVNKWQSNLELKLKPMFQAAIDVLTKGGINPQQIETKSSSELLDVADNILNEIRTGDYQMLVVARHSYSKAERLIMGSVTSKIISRGAGIPVCVVE